MPIEDVFALYEGAHWELLVSFPDSLTDRLEQLRGRLTKEREEGLGGARLGDLLKIEEGTDRPD